jgi:hypothetical protein
MFVNLCFKVVIAGRAGLAHSLETTNSSAEVRLSLIQVGSLQSLHKIAAGIVRLDGGRRAERARNVQNISSVFHKSILLPFCPLSLFQLPLHGGTRLRDLSMQCWARLPEGSSSCSLPKWNPIQLSRSWSKSDSHTRCAARLTLTLACLSDFTVCRNSSRQADVMQCSASRRHAVLSALHTVRTARHWHA